MTAWTPTAKRLALALALGLAVAGLAIALAETGGDDAPPAADDGGAHDGAMDADARCAHMPEHCEGAP